MIDAIHLFRFVHLHPVTSEVEVNCRVVRLDDERTRNPFSGSLLLSELNQQAGAEEYRERAIGVQHDFLFDSLQCPKRLIRLAASFRRGRWQAACRDRRRRGGN
jgi:hypothetical protein